MTRLAPDEHRSVSPVCGSAIQLSFSYHDALNPLTPDPSPKGEGRFET
jgi:hypothetical protein